jgi:hypothetical protein
MNRKFKIYYTEHYELICSDDEIKIGDWAIHNNEEYRNTYKEKPILCTKSNCDSIQEHWDKIIAHKPLNNALILQGVPLLPEMVIKNNVQNFIEPLLKKKAEENNTIDLDAYALGLVDSYKVATKTFSEDDVCDFVEWMNLHYRALEHTIFLKDAMGTKGLLQQWNKSKIHKTPKWFVAEIKKGYMLNCDGEHIGFPVHDIGLKTTTINGKTYLVGTYE